ncbi:calcium-activated chloride channel-domain-containing protein [Astrocystis sublimbata]|nr:calcium-activated chloride channel-domain-containing protein [Astrocystis sublimbata]
MEERFNFTVSRADTFPHTDERSDLKYHDKYVIHYDFGDIDNESAISEFHSICESLESLGLQLEVRAGEDQSLLIFVRSPAELLSNEIYKSRVKDWLYGITQTQPQVDKNSKAQVANSTFEAESLLCVYHLVTWSKETGGAGISIDSGKWKGLKAVFPIHNEPANRRLLTHLSKSLFLSKKDLDEIRDLFGSKVAFYFAYMQTYLLFLSFPSITGILAWVFLPKYSFIYAIITLVGCTVFLEYWKILQADLSIRWDVRGVASLKANRPNYRYEKIFVDSSGRKNYYYPKWKSFARQLLQIPFFALCLATLGVIITGAFAIEILVSEAYQGPYQSYLVGSFAV